MSTTATDRDAVMASVRAGVPQDVPSTAVAFGTSTYAIREMVRRQQLRSFRMGVLVRIPAAAILETLGEVAA